MQIELGGASGVSQAIERYGQPREVHVTYLVGDDTFAYWQDVTSGRLGEVVPVLERSDHRYVVHTKAHYPVGTFRLLTGGVEPAEDLIHALCRETREETGLDVDIERFMGIVHHHFRRDEDQLDFVSFVFLVSQNEGQLVPEDEDEGICEFREVVANELLTEASQMEALTGQWADWGRFRATVHRLVWEELDHQNG